MKEATLSDNSCLLGKLKLESLVISCDHTWEVGSARTDIPSAFPLTFCRKSGKRALSVPRNSEGRGSKS